MLDSKTVCTAAELSAYIGISPRSIREHVATGVITRAGPGKYLLKKSVTGYATWLQERASAKTEDPLGDSRTRLVAAKADIVERQLKTFNDRHVDRAEADAEWASMVKAMREGLGALPARVAKRLPHLDQHALSIIESEVRDALAPIADKPEAAANTA
jgi:phage terminase Nu1 subunit (DNA packaging protein)